jgi:predicted PurR-regulated permease PerM
MAKLTKHKSSKSAKKALGTTPSTPIEGSDLNAPSTSTPRPSSAWTMDRIVRCVITLVVIIALACLIKRLSGVLLPFLISFVVAYMLAPIVDFFQHQCRLRNRLLSVLVTLVLVMGLITGSIAAVVPAITRQTSALSTSVKDYLTNVHTNEFFSERINERFEEVVQSFDVQAFLSNADVQQTIKELVPHVSNWISNGVSAIAGFAIVFICLLYIIFLLIDYEKISNSWQDYIPQRYRNKMQILVSDLSKHMNGYFRGQALVAGIVGILFAIGFQIIGLPMGIGIGLMIGVLNLVPYLQVLGIPPCIILGLIQAAETGRPVWVVLLCIAAVFVVVQAIQDLVLVPKIMGNVTGMGPAMILLSLSVWGALLGIVGMIIALPITTLIISYYKQFILNKH